LEVDRILNFELEEYEILDLIGQGGMSRVYLAESVSNGERVAIKFLAPQTLLDPKFTARFHREIRVLSGLRHPNIVPILDYGEVDGFPYIVMPYSTAGTLQDRLASEQVSIDEISSFISGLSEALQYLHDQGIVHRDVKPSNILIDENGKASLSDFGLVHEIDTSQSLTGSVVIGTPAFMSPEQCGGMEISAASDQYALSVVLYLMLTGRIPFEASTPMAILVKQIHDPVPSPKRYNPEVPFVVEAVLLRGLDKDPEARFTSIRDFNEAFQAALDESLDPETGGFIPDPVDHFADTKAMPGVEAEGSSGQSELFWNRLPRPVRVAMAFLPMFAVFFLPGIVDRMNGSQDPVALERSGSPTANGLQATIDALSTENARALGLLAFPGKIETAVAGTLQVLEATMNESRTPMPDRLAAEIESTPTATLIYNIFFNPTNIPDDDGIGGGSNPESTPTLGSGTQTPTVGPSSIASASPTIGGSPGSTSVFPTSSDPTQTAPYPSSTPAPATSTSVAPATSTPIPPPPPTSTAQPPTATAEPSTPVPTEGHPHCDELPTRNPNYCPPGS
jgi:serine/threonine protein kinase